MLDFEIDLSTIRAIGDVADRLRDFGPALAETGAYLERTTKQRFLDEKDPDGKPWAPLKPSTLRQKKTNAILRETSTLAASITFLPPTQDSVRVVAGVEYGVFHQTGTKKMVARPFLGINNADVEAIKGIFSDHIQGTL